MNRIKLIICGFALLFAASGCKSYSKTTVTTDVQGPVVIQKPVIADLEVQGVRVTGTATSKGSTSIEGLKQEALNDALTKSKADILVEPRYEIISSFNHSTVNVTGYPATYKNFRSMEASDTLFLSNAPLNVSTAPRALKKDNTRRNKIIGLSIGGFFGAFLLAGLFALIF